jgi:uracil-DNA glycosylase
MTNDQLPSCWMAALNVEFSKPYFELLSRFVEQERLSHEVFPPAEDVFNAFRLTPLTKVRVLVLGQDPYHDDGQAHGLSFSVRPGVKIPPSLRNIFKELEADLGITPAAHGCLTSWAQQGVLMLNTVLTVRAHEANSHQKKGWEQFTDAVIQSVNELPRVVFVLWGKPAQKKADLIDDRHLVIQTAHPSPLSARRGFFGSQPFSRINASLASTGGKEIDWSLPETATT